MSGNDVAVDVFVGTDGAPGAGKYTIPLLQHNCSGRVDLQPDDQNSHLVIGATGNVVVQLVINDGSLNGVTCLPA